MYLPFLRDMTHGLPVLGRPELPDRRAHAVRRPARQPAARLRLHADLLPDAPAALSAVRAGARRSSGYEPALLLVSMLASIAAVLLFYRLARDVWKLPSPVFLSLVFLFLPPRWLLYRSTGATESLSHRADARSRSGASRRSRVGPRRARRGPRDADADLGADDRAGVRRRPAAAAPLALARVARAHSGRALRVLPLLRGALRRLLRLPRAARREARARSCPFGFLPMLFQKGLYHQVEFHILLFLVYAVGTFRLRERFPVLFWYCVFELALLVCVSTEDWSRYFLAMAPFALVVGLPRRDRHARFFRWMLPVFAALSRLLRVGRDPAERLSARHLPAPARAPRAAAAAAERRPRPSRGPTDGGATTSSAAAWRATPRRNGERSYSISTRWRPGRHRDGEVAGVGDERPERSRRRRAPSRPGRTCARRSGSPRPRRRRRRGAVGADELGAPGAPPCAGAGRVRVAAARAGRRPSCGSNALRADEIDRRRRARAAPGAARPAQLRQRAAGSRRGPGAARRPRDPSRAWKSGCVAVLGASDPARAVERAADGRAPAGVEASAASLATRLKKP